MSRSLIERSRMAGLAALVCITAGSAQAQPPAAARPPLRTDLTPEEQRTIRIFESASQSVVFVTNLAIQQDFFSRNVSTTPRGSGSGIVWDRRGHIVTNYHVIRGANAVHITLADRSVWPAELVGYHAAKDIAVLRIAAPERQLTPLPVGSSSDLLVGQHVHAIGNPFGLDHTLSTGVISGLDREIMSANRRPIQGVIQTDAAINPGNSGGPLLDSQGRLIGINTAIFSPSGASAGIGFAVPIDTVKRIVGQLIEHGRVTRPGLGLRIDESGLAQRLGVNGVFVMSFARGSGPDRAAMRPMQRNVRTGQLILGDLIVGLNGERVRTAVDFYRALDRLQVGQQARVRLERDGRELEVTLPLTAESDE